MIILNRYNWIGVCQKHISYSWGNTSKRHVCFQCYLFFILSTGVFFSKSPLMVVTLETRVQRELQPATSVFNRFKVDLNNTGLRIQRLPELLLQHGSHGFRRGGKLMPKKPSCLYGIQGIAFIFYLVFLIPEITLYIRNLNIKIPVRHHIFILLYVYMAFSPFKWFPQLFPAVKAEVELRPLKKHINKCLKIPMNIKIIDQSRFQKLH